MAKTSFEDLKDRTFWVAIFAEFIGTMFLVLLACGSATPWPEKPPSTLQISLCFGWSVATIVWCIAHVSGGHINPAVTFGFLLARRISLIRFIFYLVAQITGAIFGAGLLKNLAPPFQGGNTFGTSSPGENVREMQAFGVELLITFIFVLTIFATCDDHRKGFKGSGPLSIGLALATCHFWAVPFTGAGMNPARVLGPAIVSSTWNAHWVYWVGPLVGGGMAALLYEHLFAANAGPGKTRAFFSERSYDTMNFPSTPPVSVAPSELTQLKP